MAALREDEPLMVAEQDDPEQARHGGGEGGEEGVVGRRAG